MSLEELEELDQISKSILYHIFKVGEIGISKRFVREKLGGKIKPHILQSRFNKLENKDIIEGCGKRYRNIDGRGYWLPHYRVTKKYKSVVSKFFSDKSDVYEKMRIQ